MRRWNSSVECSTTYICGILVEIESHSSPCWHAALFTRFCCFLCEWDFGTKDCHCCVKEWYGCEKFEPGQKDTRNVPLVHLKKIFLLSLHMTKSFVKVLDHDGKAFQYLLQNSQQISETKIKEGTWLVLRCEGQEFQYITRVDWKRCFRSYWK
jgi:hypothetical protein